MSNRHLPFLAAVTLLALIPCAGCFGPPVVYQDAGCTGDEITKAETSIETADDGTVTKRFYKEICGGRYTETLVIRRPDGKVKKSYRRGKNIPKQTTPLPTPS